MEPVTCVIRGEADLYVAVGHGRSLAELAGFSTADRTRVEIAILELGRNLIAHAGGGALSLSALGLGGQRPGVQVEARDSGPGIADLALAMRDGYSTTRTLGAGLPGVRRLMDEFTIESTPGVGTYVRAIRWRSARAR